MLDDEDATDVFVAALRNSVLLTCSAQTLSLDHGTFHLSGGWFGFALLLPVTAYFLPVARLVHVSTDASVSSACTHCRRTDAYDRSTLHAAQNESVCGAAAVTSLHLLCLHATTNWRKNRVTSSSTNMNSTSSAIVQRQLLMIHRARATVCSLYGLFVEPLIQFVSASRYAVQLGQRKCHGYVKLSGKSPRSYIIIIIMYRTAVL